MEMQHTDTASRLASLGVPAHCIAKHLAGLQAATKARRVAHARRAKQEQTLPRVRHTAPPSRTLSADQLRQFVVVLAAGPAPGQRWHWRLTRALARDWIGHAFEQATGLCASEERLAPALAQLQERGLAKAVPGPLHRRVLFCEVLPPPAPPAPASFEQRLASAEQRVSALRERLHQPKPHRERLHPPKVARERLPTGYVARRAEKFEPGSRHSPGPPPSSQPAALPL